MATRCLIIFKNSLSQVVTYRHWDGYPEAVIPEIKEFLKWNGERSKDISYTIANYFYFMKKSRVESRINDKWFKKQYPNKQKRLEIIKEDSELTGFGLCDKIEDYGQEYEYTVNLDTGVIKQK